MPDRENKGSRRELADALFDFVQGPEEDVRDVPMDKVLDDLRETGLDPAPLAKMMREGLRASRAADDLRKARAERERIKRLLSERTAGHYTRQDLRKRILEILGANPKLSVAYRKFEEVDEADLDSLLKDLNLLEGLSDQDAR
jgi:hypothetical protein